MEKSGEQPPQQQGEPKRGAEEMSLDAPMPPIFGNANQSEGDVFKVRLHMSPVCITPHAKKAVCFPNLSPSYPEIRSCGLCAD